MVVVALEIILEAVVGYLPIVTRPLGGLNVERYIQPLTAAFHRLIVDRLSMDDSLELTIGQAEGLGCASTTLDDLARSQWDIMCCLVSSLKCF